MLSNSTTGRRLTGRVLVLAAVAVALPLTATRAIEYVDILAPDASSASPVKAPAPVLPVPALYYLPPLQVRRQYRWPAQLQVPAQVHQFQLMLQTVVRQVVRCGFPQAVHIPVTCYRRLILPAPKASVVV